MCLVKSPRYVFDEWECSTFDANKIKNTRRRGKMSHIVPQLIQEVADGTASCDSSRNKVKPMITTIPETLAGRVRPFQNGKPAQADACAVVTNREDHSLRSHHTKPASYDKKSRHPITRKFSEGKNVTACTMHTLLQFQGQLHEADRVAETGRVCYVSQMQ